MNIHPLFDQTLSPSDAKNEVIIKRKLKDFMSEKKLQVFRDAELVPERHSAFRSKQEPKANGSFRTVYVADIMDQASAYLVKPGWEAAWLTHGHEDIFGLGAGKGPGAAVLKLHGSLTEQFDTAPDVVLTDIRAFYDTVIRVAHKDLGVGERQVAQMDALLEAYDRVALSPGRGYPQGSPLAPILAALALEFQVLSGFRKAFTGRPMLVYADDICMVARNQGQGVRMLSGLNQRLNKVGMQIAGPKTKMIRVKPGESFVYMGYELRIHCEGIDIGIPDDRFTRLVEHIIGASSIENAVQIGAGWIGSMSIVTSAGDRERAQQLVESCWRAIGIPNEVPAPASWRPNDAA